MFNFLKLILPALIIFQVGTCYAILNFFDAQLYIPFFDYLWKFDRDCQVRCHRISIKCFFPPSSFSVCTDIRFKHQCCEQFSITTTSTTTTSTTSTTTPSTTTSTENPLVELCSPTRREMCGPEPGCSLSPYYPFWNTWQRQRGCDHKCWEHCFDPCACKTAANGKCEYHPSTGMCIARRECGQMSFKESDCRRANSFYSIGGFLCHNRESSETNCENGTTVFAVNIAGEAITDKRNIFYIADNEELYEDKYNTRMDDSRAVNQIEDADKRIYGSYAFGKASGKDKGQCLQYSIKVDQDGDYELSVRTVEPEYIRVGERIFSLTINQVPIALHVDLNSLSDRLTPVDIIANFRIETSLDKSIRRSITVKGHPSMEYKSHLKVELCISDCRLCEEYKYLDPGYVGSGLSLIRF